MDFWSRRKESVRKEEAAEVAADAARVEAKAEAALAETPDETLLADAGLPQPEELDSAEAVRAFMSSALPQRLKTRALRRLWRLNPVLANLDGLIDYGEDFTDSATVLDNLQTAYTVGKGMQAHVEHLAAEAEAEAEAAEDEQIAPDLSNAPEPVMAATEPNVRDEAPAPLSSDPPPRPPVPDAATQPVEVAVAEESAPPAPRRMQFRFQETV